MRWSIFFLLVVVGCTTTAYVPLETVADGSATPSRGYAPTGRTADGTVQVVGLEARRLAAGPGQASLYLHVRLEADDHEASARWLFSPNEQLLSYDGALLAPAFAQTSTGRPVLGLDPGQGGWIDLFFPLPPERDPENATVWWHVRRGAETFAGGTPLVLVSGRFPRYASPYPSLAFYLTGSRALGWWWPEACFALPSRRRWTGLDHDPTASARWAESSSAEHSGDSGGGTTWTPAGGTPALSAGDAAKSGWRGGGHH
jgi:hypothetical protein